MTLIPGIFTFYIFSAIYETLLSMAWLPCTVPTSTSGAAWGLVSSTCRPGESNQWPSNKKTLDFTPEPIWIYLCVFRTLWSQQMSCVEPFSCLFGCFSVLNQVSSCFSYLAERCNSVLLWSSRTVLWTTTLHLSLYQRGDKDGILIFRWVIFR